MVTVTGRVRVVEVEGRHFELEPLAGKGEGPARYVLVPPDEEVASLLAASVGAAVRVRGILHEGPSFFMRGPVLRVLAVTRPRPERTGRPSRLWRAPP